MDIRFANELGYTIKLLAEAWADGTAVALHVAPVLLRHTDLLAQVRVATAELQSGDRPAYRVLWRAFTSVGHHHHDASP